MKTNCTRWTVRLLAVVLIAAGLLTPPRSGAQPYVFLTEVPDYDWHAGCFGTASGNLAGYWDRHGYTNIYTGPVDGGLAPLGSAGKNGIRSLWASEAGLDGRPASKAGHIDDYYITYESTGQDPYITANRPEHSPDCIGDFIGLSQNKWASLAGECRGNIDAYSFVFWDKTGNRRQNYYTTNDGVYIPDIGSGFKDWMRWRGYDADVFTQLTDFNAERSTTAGFTYEDVKREINAGNPVLCFLQRPGVYHRPSGVNPEIHGVMIFGYFSDPFNAIEKGVLIKTSWGSGFDPDNPGLAAQQWTGSAWLGLYPVRGVIGFRPKPKIHSIARASGQITIAWEGPASYLRDYFASSISGPLQRYVVQQTGSLTLEDWKTVAGPTTNRTVTFPEPTSNSYYRVVVQK